MLDEESQFTAPYPDGANPPIKWVRALLQAVIPYCSSQEWLQIAEAVHHATRGRTEGLDVLDRCSTGRPDYVGRDKLATVWPSLGSRPREHSGIETLCRLVEAHGSDWVEVCDRTEPPFEMITDPEGAGSVTSTKVPLSLAGIIKFAC